jgi:16S rRNA (cytosine1402-N4)-methyltransferase
MKNLDCDHFPGVSLEPIDKNSLYHVPVLGRQVMAFLRPGPGALFLDGTVGGGGHSRMILETGAEIVALDQDPEALAECRRRLAEFGNKVRFVQSNFCDARESVERLEEKRLFTGALLDLGVFSHQLDSAGRGFSFQQDGPLDMRMGPGVSQTAADAVNHLDAEELAGIFRNFGEEPAARRIAAHLVEARKSRPFETTLQLAEAIAQVVPRRGPRHPATRVFQALRIHVNDELGSLRRALQAIPGLLAPGGRFAVITFHSLEDRIVKVFFREQSREWIDRPEWPAPRRNPDRHFQLLTPHPITASVGEIRENPRARSAKLRVAEKL